MADIMSAFSGIGSGVKSTITWLIPAIGIMLVLGVILYIVMQRRKFNFPVTILSEREGGGFKEVEVRGGFVARRGTSPYFRIKFGLFKFRDLITPPKLEGITGINRIYYYQKDIDTFVQMRREIDPTIIKFVPVEADVKYGAVLAIKRIRDIMSTQSAFSKYAGPASFVIGIVIVMICFYMLLKKFSPELMQQVAETTRQAAAELARAKAGG